VLTDSTCDLTPEEQQRFGVSVIALNVLSGGRTYLDHQDISAPQLFAAVRGGGALPSTTPPTAQQYHQRLEDLLALHDHVLCLHLSSKLSETVQVARIAAEAYHGRVTVIDSLQSSGALAMQAERAARLLRGGALPFDVATIMGAASTMSCTRMSLDTLDYLRGNGRIGAAAALLGGFLNLKPIVGLEAGQVIAVGRERGLKAAHLRLVRLLSDQLQTMGQGNARAVIFDNGDSEGADLLARTVSTAGAQLFARSQLGSVLSAHGGPGVCGFSIEPVTVYHQFRGY
jgi:DegV family protein with EDD domain